MRNWTAWKRRGPKQSYSWKTYLQRLTSPRLGGSLLIGKPAYMPSRHTWGLTNTKLTARDGSAQCARQGYRFSSLRTEIGVRADLSEGRPNRRQLSSLSRP